MRVLFSTEVPGIQPATYRFPRDMTDKNLSLCLTKHHPMKTYWGMEVYFHAFLNSALRGSVEAGMAQWSRAGLWAVRSGFNSRQGLQNFLFTTASRPALRPTQPPIQWVLGALSLGVKRPGRKSDHSPPSSAEVKECVELYVYSSQTLHGVMLR
jgi:hypothetical protein